MPIQMVFDGDETTLALLITNLSELPLSNNFFTQSSDSLQFAIFKHPEGHSIQRHWHPPFQRVLDSTSEVLIIQSGLVKTSIYDNNLKLVHAQTLASGDVAVLLSGGHGFEIIEDAVILEVKQGPYAGVKDKRIF